MDNIHHNSFSKKAKDAAKMATAHLPNGFSTPLAGDNAPQGVFSPGMKQVATTPSSVPQETANQEAAELVSPPLNKSKKKGY